MTLYFAYEKTFHTEKDENTPDERAPALVKACCTGRVHRILEELTEQSATSEITLPRKK